MKEEYPFANGKRVHIDRAERALGKPLPKGAHVHHADGSRNADAPLVICQDLAYHMLLHARMRIVRAGGNPNTDAMCHRCQLPRPLSEFVAAPKRSTGRSSRCRPCDAIQARESRARRGDEIRARRRERWLYRKDEVNAMRRRLRAEQVAS